MIFFVVLLHAVTRALSGLARRSRLVVIVIPFERSTGGEIRGITHEEVYLLILVG